MITGIPVEYAVSIIQNYILQMKGVMMHIETPIQPQHEEKFIKALNIACAYFNITF